MILNPTKCKCLVVDFFYGNSCTWSPIVIRNMVVEHMHMFKLLSVTITDNLKWDSHCDIVVRKANKSNGYMPYANQRSAVSTIKILS